MLCLHDFSSKLTQCAEEHSHHPLVERVLLGYACEDSTEMTAASILAVSSFTTDQAYV